MTKEIPLSEKVHKGYSEIDLPPYIDKLDVKKAVERLNKVRDEIYKEMEKPLKDPLELLAFKVWLVGKFEEIDNIFGRFEDE